MDRLTGKHYDRGDYYMECSGSCANDDEMCGGCLWLEKIINRLGAYEDTGLEPDVCAEYKKFENEAVGKGVLFQRIVELMEAEKEGRLVVLPCKVGDSVFVLRNNTDACSNCDYYSTFYGMDSMCIREGAGNKSYPSLAESPICDKQFMEISERAVGLNWIVSNRDDFGKTVFLTREDADAALKGCDEK